MEDFEIHVFVIDGVGILFGDEYDICGYAGIDFFGYADHDFDGQ
jgi:hypothetical protein